MKTAKRALVILSGGQDSTTCLFWAISRYGRENVRAIGFDYGQRHKNELLAAQEICADAGIFYRIVPLPFLGQMTQNALTRSEMELDNADYGGAYPNTFVEGRNLLFLSLAAIEAKQQGISEIIIGVSQADFSGYPDCRNVFIKSANTTLTLAMDYDFEIIAPLMWKSKAEIWHMAEELGCFAVIRDKTLTCYKGIFGAGCGHCPACVLRRQGLDAYRKEREKDGGEK